MADSDATRMQRGTEESNAKPRQPIGRTAEAQKSLSSILNLIITFKAKIKQGKIIRPAVDLVLLSPTVLC